VDEPWGSRVVEFTRAGQRGQASFTVTGDAVFQKLKADVLEHPGPVRTRLQEA